MKRKSWLPLLLLAGLALGVAPLQAQNNCMAQQMQCNSGCRGNMALLCIQQCTNSAMQCVMNSRNSDSDTDSPRSYSRPSRSDDDDSDTPRPSYQSRQPVRNDDTARAPSNNASSSASGGSGGQCQDATSFVAAESRHETGPGHCDGEVGVWLTNRSNQRVVCNVVYEQPNGTFGGGEMTGVASGQRIGGEAGGLWSCGVTGRIKYYCAVQPDWRNDMMCRSPF